MNVKGRDCDGGWRPANGKNGLWSWRRERLCFCSREAKEEGEVDPKNGVAVFLLCQNLDPKQMKKLKKGELCVSELRMKKEILKWFYGEEGVCEM